MATPKLVSNPEQINPQWLTQVLRHAGHDCEVSDFTMKSIGTGQVGENVRFSLQGANVPVSTP